MIENQGGGVAKGIFHAPNRRKPKKEKNNLGLQREGVGVVKGKRFLQL